MAKKTITNKLIGEKIREFDYHGKKVEISTELLDLEISISPFDRNLLLVKVVDERKPQPKKVEKKYKPTEKEDSPISVDEEMLNVKNELDEWAKT
jgi:hypothetical protein